MESKPASCYGPTSAGAIAFGQTLSASGARIITNRVSALQQRGGSHDLQTMRDGGMANASFIERLWGSTSAPRQRFEFSSNACSANLRYHPIRRIHLLS